MITIRKAQEKDIESFKQVIEASLFALCKNHYSKQELHALLSLYPGKNLYKKWIAERVLLVAEDRGKIVGFAQYFPPNSSLEALHVSPERCNQGIGRKLLQAIEIIARDLDANTISFDASLNAVVFYEKCGYIKDVPGKIKCKDSTGIMIEIDVVKFAKNL
jgi:putative acetyltransferase